MAKCVRFVCDHCGDAIESWDEGNPYYIDARGEKQYGYHPEPERELCIGVDSPHLCLNCGKQFYSGLERSDDKFPSVRIAPKIVATFHLDGNTCPGCKIGVFRIDPEFLCVSMANWKLA
jgi:hypothetical protein